MKIKRNNLLLIAAIVWFLAGLNILKIAFIVYEKNWSIGNIFLSGLVFFIFFLGIFKRLVIKHTYRILSYEDEKVSFIKFFDLKSFIIMTIMMTLGIVIRKFNLWSDLWIAVFYLGLGSALSLAGLEFSYKFLKEKKFLAKARFNCREGKENL